MKIKFIVQPREEDITKEIFILVLNSEVVSEIREVNIHFLPLYHPNDRRRNDVFGDQKLRTQRKVSDTGLMDTENQRQGYTFIKAKNCP